MDLRLIHRLGWIGLAIPALLLIDAFGLGLNEPGYGASGATVIAYYRHHTGAEIANTYFIILLLIAIMVFCAVLHRALVSITGQRIFPAVVFGGGVVFLAASATGGYAGLALLDGSHNHMSPAAAEAMNALNNAIPIGFVVGAIIISGATACCLLGRSRLAAPARKLTVLGWISLVLFVALVTPVGPFALLVFALWIPVIGFMLPSSLPGAAQKVPATSPVRSRA